LREIWTHTRTEKIRLGTPEEKTSWIGSK